MRGKILITFFVVSLLLAIIPYDTVNATSSSVTIGFEGCVAGNPYTGLLDSVNFTSRIRNGTTATEFSVSSISNYSGTRNFIQTGKRAGWFNLTYSKSLYLTNMSFWIDLTTVTSGAYIELFFYNKTYQENKMQYNKGYYSGFQENCIIYIKISSSGGVWSWVYSNELGAGITFSTQSANAVYKKFYFGIEDTVGNVVYGNSTINTHGVACNGTAINNNLRIDRIFIYQSFNTVAQVIHYDNIGLTVSSSYASTGGGVTTCGYDLSSYQKIGIDNTPNTADITGYQLMKIYNVYTTGTLEGVSLCVSSNQYSYDSNLANYTCTLLGFDLGGADCFYQDGFMYRLFWKSNIDLGDYSSENQQSGYLLYSQFFHTKKLWGNTYWQPCIGSIGSDLDSDGNTYFKYGSTIGVPQIRYERDLGVSFYLTGAYHNASYGLPDKLGLHNYVGSNATGYQYSLGQPEGIVCSYMLNSGAYSYKIEIYRNLTNLVYTHFNLQYPSGVIGYIPIAIGRYTFKLYNYHYVYNITAYVSGTLPSFFISTNPVITNPFQSYDIFYKFYHAQGKTGIIGIFHEQSECNDFNSAYQHIDITNNITSTYPYSSSSTDTEYLTLFINNTQKSPVFYAIHIIRNTNIGENYILVDSENIEITEGNPENNNITIFGNHLFPLCDIGIYIDGAPKKSVKYEQVFSYDYIPLLGGEHNVSLRVMMNGTLTTVAYCHFTVTVITPEGEEGGGGDIGGLLPPPYSYIMGALVTIVLMILPSIALGKIGISQGESLKYVPIFSGTMGFILSCLIGFFPWYSIFALLFVLILIITVLYLSKNKSG